jgi:alkylhydroperoxidase/carboxymuconolactone decarboxylase family protein YurZ
LFEEMVAQYNRKKYPTGDAMLKPKQDELANEFYQAAFADGEVDAKTKILIGAAVSMTVGCYP